MRKRPASKAIPTDDALEPAERSAGRRIHGFAASALLMVYLAVMNGHLTSVDGLLMERQARALVFDHSIRFQTPALDWSGEPMWTSQYGIGLSLLYVPGMVFASPLASLVPVPEPATAPKPLSGYPYFRRQLYENPLYAVGGAWVHAVVVALAAYCVARLMTALGCSRTATLWGMAFYGLGSSAFVYARGDFSQPLEGLCWTAALFAALRFRQSGASGALWGCAAALGYAILTRPLEGLLVVPAALVLLLPSPPLSVWQRRVWQPVLTAGTGALVGVIVTLLVNWARFGDPLAFGYSGRAQWHLLDMTTIAAVLVSPARGILWEFPALVLVPLGALALLRRHHQREALTVLVLSGALLVNTASWHVWWGGWCWGLRLFQPAIPLLAVLAGAAVDQLGPGTRRWLPTLPLVAGFAWGLPGVITDILGGYGEMADRGSQTWNLATWPPYGAWRFVTHVFAETPTDGRAIDIVWVRLGNATGNWSLLVPVVLLLLAAVFFGWSRRELLAEARNEKKA